MLPWLLVYNGSIKELIINKVSEVKELENTFFNVFITGELETLCQGRSQQLQIELLKPIHLTTS